MPVSKKKGTTSPSNASTPEPSELCMPDQQSFHQYLCVTQSAVRTVIEAVMIQELDAFSGAAWGECSPKRKGYRNGCTGYLGHPFKNKPLRERKFSLPYLQTQEGGCTIRSRHQHPHARTTTISCDGEVFLWLVF